MAIKKLKTRVKEQSIKVGDIVAVHYAPLSLRYLLVVELDITTEKVYVLPVIFSENGWIKKEVPIIFPLSSLYLLPNQQLAADIKDDLDNKITSASLDSWLSN